MTISMTCIQPTLNGLEVHTHRVSYRFEVCLSLSLYNVGELAIIIKGYINITGTMSAQSRANINPGIYIKIQSQTRIYIVYPQIVF